MQFLWWVTLEVVIINLDLFLQWCHLVFGSLCMTVYFVGRGDLVTCVQSTTGGLLTRNMTSLLVCFILQALLSSE